MRKYLAFGLAIAAVALLMPIAAQGQTRRKGDNVSAPNGHTVHIYPTRNAGPLPVLTNNLQYHGGRILENAKVRPIFWGSYWSGGAGATQANQIIAYLQQFGTNKEYNTITQYYDTVHGGTQYVSLHPLLVYPSDAIYDPADPPSCNECFKPVTKAPAVEVTDSEIQDEVAGAAFDFNDFDPNTIFMVFLPPGTYLDDGFGDDSCGGPNLQFCAYHSELEICFVAGAKGSDNCAGDTLIYAAMPYPSCHGCWAFSSYNGSPNNIFDFEHFISHETREAVTDPDVNCQGLSCPGGWFDIVLGAEADDKCAWSPFPFFDASTGGAYQDEWSNLNRACIKWR